MTVTLSLALKPHPVFGDVIAITPTSSVGLSYILTSSIAISPVKSEPVTPLNMILITPAV